MSCHHVSVESISSEMVESGQQQKVFVPLTEGEYAEMLQSFDTAADSLEKMDNLIIPILQEFGEKPIHFMSIGSGNGYFDEVIIKKHDLHVDFYYGMEPFEGRRKQLEERAASWKIEHFIDRRYFNEDFETDIKFDLILLSHVLYFMQKPIESILKAMGFLKDQGKLVIFHNTKVGIPEINYKMLELLNSCSLDLVTNCDARLTIETISQGLNNSAVKHVLLEMESYLDVTEFIKKRVTPKANYVVSFMLQTRFEKLPMVVQEQIYKIIQEGSLQIPTERGNGKYLFLIPVGMIVATKAQ